MGDKIYSKQAAELLARLKSSGIIGGVAESTFEMLGVRVQGIDRNVVGYSLQGWLAEWMTQNSICARSPENSQESPDFFLSDDDGESLLELKTFDSDASANFDVANFEAYAQLICEQPEHLDADYLILSYRVDISSRLQITDVWLKKVWEITGPSGAHPLKVQQKRGVIYNIRPVAWMSARVRFAPFNNKEDFLKAIYWTLNEYRGATSAERWRVELSNAMGLTLVI